MSHNTKIGKKGEEIAQRFLAKKNYQVLETNWRFGKKEIDIITCKEDLLVIVEVKTRVGGFESPREQVHLKKQRSIITATNAYIMEKDIQKETRFDVVIIDFEMDNEEYRIEHIEDAFYPIVK
jgi:putative endonuclease